MDITGILEIAISFSKALKLSSAHPLRSRDLAGSPKSPADAGGGLTV